MDENRPPQEGHDVSLEQLDVVRPSTANTGSNASHDDEIEYTDEQLLSMSHRDFRHVPTERLRRIPGAKFVQFKPGQHNKIPQIQALGLAESDRKTGRGIFLLKVPGKGYITWRELNGEDLAARKEPAAAQQDADETKKPAGDNPQDPLKPVSVLNHTSWRPVGVDSPTGDKQDSRDQRDPKNNPGRKKGEADPQRNPGPERRTRETRHGRREPARPGDVYEHPQDHRELIDSLPVLIRQTREAVYHEDQQDPSRRYWREQFRDALKEALQEKIVRIRARNPRARLEAEEAAIERLQSSDYMDEDYERALTEAFQNAERRVSDLQARSRGKEPTEKTEISLFHREILSWFMRQMIGRANQVYKREPAAPRPPRASQRPGQTTGAGKSKEDAVNIVPPEDLGGIRDAGIVERVPVDENGDEAKKPAAPPAGEHIPRQIRGVVLDQEFFRSNPSKQEQRRVNPEKLTNALARYKENLEEGMILWPATPEEEKALQELLKDETWGARTREAIRRDCIWQNFMSSETPVVTQWKRFVPDIRKDLRDTQTFREMYLRFAAHSPSFARMKIRQRYQEDGDFDYWVQAVPEAFAAPATSAPQVVRAPSSGESRLTPSAGGKKEAGDQKNELQKESEDEARVQKALAEYESALQRNDFFNPPSNPFETAALDRLLQDPEKGKKAGEVQYLSMVLAYLQSPGDYRFWERRGVVFQRNDEARRAIRVLYDVPNIALRRDIRDGVRHRDAKEETRFWRTVLPEVFAESSPAAPRELSREESSAAIARAVANTGKPETVDRKDSNAGDDAKAPSVTPPPPSATVTPSVTPPVGGLTGPQSLDTSVSTGKPAQPAHETISPSPDTAASTGNTVVSAGGAVAPSGEPAGPARGETERERAQREAFEQEVTSQMQRYEDQLSKGWSFNTPITQEALEAFRRFRAKHAGTENGRVIDERAGDTIIQNYLSRGDDWVLEKWKTVGYPVETIRRDRVRMRVLFDRESYKGLLILNIQARFHEEKDPFWKEVFPEIFEDPLVEKAWGLAENRRPQFEAAYRAEHAEELRSSGEKWAEEMVRMDVMRKMKEYVSSLIEQINKQG